MGTRQCISVCLSIVIFVISILCKYMILYKETQTKKNIHVHADTSLTRAGIEPRGSCLHFHNAKNVVVEERVQTIDF